MVLGLVMKERILTSPPQKEHSKGSISNFLDHRVPRMHPQKGGRRKQCCMEDEGRSLGIGLQGQVPNRPKLRWSKARVVSVVGKGAR